MRKNCVTEIFHPTTMSSTTWKVLDLKNKWDVLNTSLNAIGDHLAVNAAELPTVNQFSADSEFRILLNALGTMRSEIADLSREISSQTENLSIDVKYFYDLAKDYESEIGVFKKGRDQAFQLYDNLSVQHSELLREFETVKADLKSVSETIESASEDKRVADEALGRSQASNDALLEELTGMRISMATLQKRLEILEEENERLSSIKTHEDQDRNDLIDQLAKEVKSRNDALVLAEAARNELSRMIGEAEQDRLARDAAEAAKAEAIASVDGLHEMIQELQQQIEEQEKINKHEMVMRHKVEESLIEVEDEFKLKSDELETTVRMLEEADARITEVEAAENKWRDEKDTLTSQIGILAQQIAGDKLENQQLKQTLEQVQQAAVETSHTADDAVEKSKQMERIVNQLIQDKAELEAAISRVEAEKAKILEDAKESVAVRAKLDETASNLKTVTDLFDQEKRLKSEVVAQLEKAEKLVANHAAETAKLAESLAAATKERDDLKQSLDGVQKVLHAERLVTRQLPELQAKLQQEEQLKSQALSSLEAESRSKQEAIKQLEEARKADGKSQAAAEKLRTENDSFKDKMKEEERVKKDLNKQIDELRKELGKSQTEVEKVTRAKEETSRKSEAESAALKESEKGWNSEKSEHEKTFKAYLEEKANREKFEIENKTLKSAAADATNAVESERVEHGKTFKAYEAERVAHAALADELTGLKSMVAGAQSKEQSLLADLQGAEKRIKRLEATVAELTEAKADVAQLPALKRQVEQAEKVKADLEAKLASEREKRTESENKIAEIRQEDEKLQIRINNVAMENEKLVKRVARLEGELEGERKTKNDLLQAFEHRPKP